MTATTMADLIHDLDAVSANGLGMWRPCVPVRPETPADLARIEARSITETIEKGGTVEYSRNGGRRFKIEQAIGMPNGWLWMALDVGLEVTVQVTGDRALRQYSLTFTPRNPTP